MVEIPEIHYTIPPTEKLSSREERRKQQENKKKQRSTEGEPGQQHIKGGGGGPDEAGKHQVSANKRESVVRNREGLEEGAKSVPKGGVRASSPGTDASRNADGER